MVKLAVSLCVIFLAHSTPRKVPFSLLPTYSEDLEAALTNFKTEVKFVINEARMVTAQHNGLLETLHNSATSVQKEVQDTINTTMTRFGRDTNSLFTHASVDISKCMELSSIIESTATDILMNTNICVHDKLNKAEMYIEKSILAIEQILTRLDVLQYIADDSFSKAKKHRKMKTVLKTEMFLKSISTEPSRVATEIISTLTDTALVISQIDDLMISDCIPTEALSSFIKDTRLVYSKIETCVAELKSSNGDLSVNDFVSMLYKLFQISGV